MVVHRAVVRGFVAWSASCCWCVVVLLLAGGARARNRDTSLSKNYRRPSRLVPGGTRFAVPYGPRTECNGRRLTSAATCMIVATSSSGKYNCRKRPPESVFQRLVPIRRSGGLPPPDQSRARGCQAPRCCVPRDEHAHSATKKTVSTVRPE